MADTASVCCTNITSHFFLSQILLEASSLHLNETNIVMPTLLGRLRRSLKGNSRRRRRHSEEYEYGRQTDDNTITTRPPRKVIIPAASSSLLSSSADEGVSPVSVFDIDHESFISTKEAEETKQPTIHSQESTMFSMTEEEEEPFLSQFSKVTAITDTQPSTVYDDDEDNDDDPLESTWQSEATSIVSMVVVSPTTTRRTDDPSSSRAPLQQISENLPPPSPKAAVIVTSSDDKKDATSALATIYTTTRSDHVAVSHENQTTRPSSTSNGGSAHLVSPSLPNQTSQQELGGVVIPSSDATTDPDDATVVTDQNELFQSRQRPRRVYIEKGGNKHKTGTVLGMKNRRTLEVQLDGDDSGPPVGVLISSVRYLEDIEEDSDDDETNKENALELCYEKVPMANGTTTPPAPDRHATNEVQQAEPGLPPKMDNTPSTTDKPSTNELTQNKSTKTKTPATTSTLLSTPDVGRKVLITKGGNKDSYAVILGMKNKGTYAVQLLSSGSEVGVRIASVEFRESTPDEQNCVQPNEKTNESPPAAEAKNLVEEVPPQANELLPSEKSELERPPSPVVQRSKDTTRTQRVQTTGSKKQIIPGGNSNSNVTTKQTRKNTPCKDTGKLVEVTRGPNKKKRGRIIGKSNAITYNIEVEPDEIIGVRTSSIKILGGGEPKTDDADNLLGEKDPGSSRSQRSNVSRRSRRFFRTLMPKDRSGNRFGGHIIKRIQVEGSVNGNSNKAGTNFLEYAIGDRLLSMDIKMKGPRQNKFANSFPQNGKTYGLISAKIEEDKESSFKYGKPKVARLQYVDTSTCVDDGSFAVKDFLSQIGNFSVLNPRKIAARLELFQSPARFAIQDVDAQLFGDIEEQGHVGCGFIAEDFLRRICEKGGMSKPKAELVSAIQVRLFIPSMGVYKGMLQRKRISSGPAVQLPPSMKKVPASDVAVNNMRAFIVVCQAGIHPSPGSANEFVGRKLDTSRKDPPIKSFTAKISKPLSDMVLDLWKSLGVPEHKIHNYKKESVKPDRRNHAWVVGVADPTGSLPPDHIFIPGMGDTQPPQLFVTRSPCLKHDHGRLLNTVNSRPAAMSKEKWEELQSLPFGSIIFSSPREGMMSMPERIACGDLDGDLYLICWDDVILSEMRDVEPMQELPMEDDGVLKTMATPNPNWLEDAHDIMTEAGSNNEMGGLVGTLYKQSEKIAKYSALNKRDPGAIAFADAYNEALEYKKHGRRIQLPAHLEKDVPKKHRHLVTFV